MKLEIQNKMHFMDLLYSSGRKEMFEGQWKELAELVNKLPDDTSKEVQGLLKKAGLKFVFNDDDLARMVKIQEKADAK
tara:strand:- start:333 stop:566 length:234 start_codon:yes stop_codon:yes gene_type:complete